MELKLVIDKSKQKVLYAETKKDFVDFLFSLMTLPLGTTVRLLKDKNIAGCLGNVRDSIDSMPDSHFERIQNKKALLNPEFLTLSTSPLLSPTSGQLVSPNQQQLYVCSHDRNIWSSAYVSDCPRSCPACCSSMVEAKWCDSIQNGIVKDVARYVVMDNLEVKPMSSVSCSFFAMMMSFGIQDFSSLEEKIVCVQSAEALRLLQLSVQTDDVLTTTFLGAVTK